jgi:hypothetical protein
MFGAMRTTAKSLDFGPFLQEEPASLVWSEKTHNPSRRPSIPVHVVRVHWDFAVGSVARPQTAKRIQGYSISGKKLTFLNSLGGVIIPAAGLCNLTEPWTS